MRALFFLMVTGYATGAAVALGLGTGPIARWASALAAVVGAAAGLGLAAGMCLAGAGFSLAAPDLLASAGGLAFRLDGLGVETQHGYVKVDDHFRTSIAGLSAIGDVITIAGRRHSTAWVTRALWTDGPRSGRPASCSTCSCSA